MKIKELVKARGDSLQWRNFSQEVGGKALQISDKFVLILHIFLINMHKHGNDQGRTYQF